MNATSNYPSGNPHDNDGLNNSSEIAIYQSKIEQTHKQMAEVFKKLDKNGDDRISEEELLSFLESKMPPGKQLNQSLFKKLFATFDKNQDNFISLNEFVNQYIITQENIKVKIDELKFELETERGNLANLEKSRREHKSEVLNNGVCPNAKLVFENIQLELVKTSLQKSLRSVYIKLKLRDVERKTSIKPLNDLYFYDVIEIPLKSKEDELVLQIFSKDNDVIFGEAAIPLSFIKGQESQVLDMNIHDSVNETNIMWKIRPKFAMIWSYYQLYQDQYQNSDKKCAAIATEMEKLNLTLDNFTDPMKFLFEERISSLAGATSQGDGSNLQHQVADQVENIIKSTFKSQNPQYLPIIKLLLYFCITLSFLNTLVKADFVNLIATCLMLVIFSTTLNSNVIQNLNYFLKAIGCGLAYDILWYCFSSGDSSSVPELNGLRAVIGYFALFAFFGKIALGIAIWLEKIRNEKTGGKKTTTPLLKGQEMVMV